jgi:hypothetical protein
MMDWRAAWEEFLEGWDAEIMAYLRNYATDLSCAEREVLDRGTIRRIGANPSDVKLAELKLKVNLSACVRSLYETSNGLDIMGFYYPEKMELLQVQSIGWLHCQKSWIVQLFQEGESVSDFNYKDYIAQPALRKESINEALLLTNPDAPDRLLVDTSHSVLLNEWDGLSDEHSHKFRAASLFGLMENERHKSISSIVSKYPNFRHL